MCLEKVRLSVNMFGKSQAICVCVWKKVRLSVNAFEKKSGYL